MQRWQQRCSDLSLDDELSQLRRPGKKIREVLQAAWQRSQPDEQFPPDRRYMVSTGGVIVVIGQDNIVITVMVLAEVKSWERRRRRTKREKAPRQRWD